MNIRRYRLFGKFLTTALLSTAFCAQIWAAGDLTTKDGKQFKNVKVLSEEPERIKVSHDSGISYIKKALLPPEFVQANELTPMAEDSAVSAAAEQAGKLQAFAQQFPTFTTRDERTFKSSEITALEPSGLKLMTDSGIVRVKFMELSEKYKTALGYDPIAAAKFEEQQAAAAEDAAAMRQRLANAASVADTTATRVVLHLRQNMGKGWMCDAEVLKTLDVTEVTSRPGSVLSGPSVIREARMKQETLIIGEIEDIMVFGLPAYVNNNKWEGTIYETGKFEFTSSGGGRTAIAYHIDRSRALRLLAEAGGPGRVLNSDGDLKGTVSGPSQATSGNGTGFAISAEGHIATAYHVIEGATEIQVYVNGKSMAGRVVASDPANDLAILKVDATTKPVVIYPGSDMTLGEDLFTIGFPLMADLGQTPKYTKGSLAGLEGGPGRLGGGDSCFQISVPIQGGNSGGPVCRKDGTVLGVVRATLSTLVMALKSNAVPQNVNFATRSSLLFSLTKKVEDLTLHISPATNPEKAVEEAVHLIVVQSKSKN